jgi:cytochrome c biogenesis protein CcmG/thiol:disulfide interchange protein DsbE
MSQRSLILLAVAVPVVALLALLAWASVGPSRGPAGAGINRKFGEVRITPAPAREFSLVLLDGRTVTLAGLRGKVVLVDFWASWCPPCQEEAATLAEVYREYAGQPVEFVGVDIWDRREDALAFVERYGVTYPSGVDQRGAIAIDYGVKGIPEKFFIDRDGVVRRKFVGPMTAENLRAVLAQLMQ